MHRLRRTVVLVAVVAVLYGILGVLLAELSLRLHKLPLGDVAEVRSRFAAAHVTMEDAAVTAADGAVLKAWLLTPQHPNGRSVIILHGITANRVSSTGFAEMFLAQGYAVLTPDSREHGDSGGAIATYGILERYDVKQWVAWLRNRAPGCTYLLGESMGAAIGLEATAVTPDLCAVAVESPYTHFRELAYERLGRGSHTGTLFWQTAGWPILEAAIVYTKLRYGIYLPDADPQSALEHSGTPALLIAGTNDVDIPMHHAQELQAACGSRCALWIVPGADHGGASSVAHAEFERRVLGWFATHDR